MKKKKLSSLLVVVLAGLIAYTIFYKHSVVNEAKFLTKELEHKVDSLKLLADRYDKMQYKYSQLFIELSKTRSKMVDLKAQLDEFNELQTEDIREIKARLQSVLVDFDSLEYRFRNSTVNTKLDSLKF